MFFNLVIDNEQYLRPKLWPNRQLPYYIYKYIIICVRWKPTKTDTFVVRIHRDGLLVHFYDPFNIERWPTIPEGRSCLLASGSLLHPRYFLIMCMFLRECNVTIAFCAPILNGRMRRDITLSNPGSFLPSEEKGNGRIFFFFHQVENIRVDQSSFIVIRVKRN